MDGPAYYLVASAAAVCSNSCRSIRSAASHLCLSGRWVTGLASDARSHESMAARSYTCPSTHRTGSAKRSSRSGHMCSGGTVGAAASTCCHSRAVRAGLRAEKGGCRAGAEKHAAIISRTAVGTFSEAAGSGSLSPSTATAHMSSCGR